ncbi:MAG: hypothetical protein K8R59_04935 [Thermoanaerobaculales bacterium]|nr:hypothetical protein [Thermoanaerobaculales bacterium]
MSLVSDALRKARQEVVERDARGKGVHTPRVVVLPATSSRIGIGLLIGAGIALAAALIGGVAAVWFVGPQRSEETIAKAVIEERNQPSSKAAPMEEPFERLEQTADEPGSEEAAGVVPTKRLAPVQISPDEIPVDGRELSSIGDDSAPMTIQEETQVEPRSEVAAADLPGSRDVVAEARIGGTTLTLGYLVYRSEDPFAEINGIDVHVGTIIEGFLVEEILRDRVVLRNDEGPLVIRVK